jgi:hypothetical protein
LGVRKSSANITSADHGCLCRDHILCLRNPTPPFSGSPAISNPTGNSPAPKKLLAGCEL